MRKIVLDNQILIERYPKRFGSSHRGIFAYQFFDVNGLNVGCYIPDMDSLQFFPVGRVYPSREKHEYQIMTAGL